MSSAIKSQWGFWPYTDIWIWILVIFRWKSFWTALPHQSWSIIVHESTVFILGKTAHDLKHSCNTVSYLNRCLMGERLRNSNVFINMLFKLTCFLHWCGKNKNVFWSPCHEICPDELTFSPPMSVFTHPGWRAMHRISSAFNSWAASKVSMFRPAW